MMPPDRWGEELGAPRTWFALCDIRAGFEPLRARGIAAAFPIRRYRCHDRGFDMSFGEPSSPRRFAVSPTRRIAVSPFRRFAVSLLAPCSAEQALGQKTKRAAKAALFCKQTKEYSTVKPALCTTSS